MNFFEQQDRARRNTGRLVILMCLAVISLIAVTSVAVVMIIAAFGPAPQTQAPVQGWLEQSMALLDWELVGMVALVVIAVVVFGSLFKRVQLGAGGRAVAEALNGRLIAAGTTDPDERKILNVVEEMAIASGTPVPPVYIIEDPAINAFAAGRTPQDAVIGITRGCIRQLTRQELQGVVAHEFSHIFHGDMRLNIRLVATLHGILLIGLIGYFLLRTAPFRRSSNRDNSAIILLALGVVLVIVGFAGTFFGNLIKAAVSRQREFLADASAVQFTRDPDGIAGALKKIGGSQAGSQVQAANATEYSHMFFGQAVSTAFSTLMATHPPLAERIRRVQPDWDGKFVTPGQHAPEREAASQQASPTPEARSRLGVLAAATAGALGENGAPRRASPAIDAARESINAIGQPDARHLDYARHALDELDTELKDAAHDPYSARALVYGLLLSPAPGIRTQQLAALSRNAQPDVYDALVRLENKLSRLEAHLRLPLLDLSIPALKQMTTSQYASFKTCLGQLIQADDQVSLMEWALYRILTHHLEEPAGGRAATSLTQCRDACKTLLSTLALLSGEPGRVQAAFAHGASALPFKNLQPLATAASASTLDNAVAQLRRLKPHDKPQLLEALARTVEHDGVITVGEAELLRAVADTLDCPMPPLLASSA